MVLRLSIARRMPHRSADNTAAALPAILLPSVTPVVIPTPTPSPGRRRSPVYGQSGTARSPQRDWTAAAVSFQQVINDSFIVRMNRYLGLATPCCGRVIRGAHRSRFSWRATRLIHGAHRLIFREMPVGLVQLGSAIEDYTTYVIPTRPHR
jgi:hypothetical protein